MNCPKPGLYKNVDPHEYRAWDAFNQSSVGLLLKSPKTYMWRKKHSLKTDALRFGNLVDCLTLTPERFNQEFALPPDTYVSEAKVDAGKVKPWSLRSPTCRKIQEDLERGTKMLTNNDEMLRACECKHLLLNDPQIGKILGESEKQVAMVWVGPDHDVLCKGLVDLLHPEGLYDLKTTLDAYAPSFLSSIIAYNYHVQGCFYSDGYCQLNGGLPMHFSFIFVEKFKNPKKPSKPRDLNLLSISATFMLIGRRMYKDAMIVYKRCKETGVWPGYERPLLPLDPPAWMIKKYLGDDNHESY